MAGYASRIRGRQIRAYTILAIGIILIFVLVAGIAGLFKTTNTSVNATPTPKVTRTPTQAPENTTPGQFTEDPFNTSEPTDEPTATQQGATPTAGEPTPTPAVSFDPSANYRMVNISSGTLNLRSEASTTSTVLDNLNKYAVIKLVEADLADGWCKVTTYDGKTGYIKQSFITDMPAPAIQTVTADTLNLRSQPSTSSTKLTQLSKNDTVLILQFNVTGDWCKIQTLTGKVGFVMQQYLSEGAGTLPTQAPAPTATNVANPTEQPTEIVTEEPATQEP